jgi:hypothetical protein
MSLHLYNNNKIHCKVKRKFHDIISHEQFGSLNGREIHDVVEVSQERLHSSKTKKILTMILKLDLSRTYHKVSWLYLILILLPIVFRLSMVNCIVGFLSSMCCNPY